MYLGRETYWLGFWVKRPKVRVTTGESITADGSPSTFIELLECVLLLLRCLFSANWPRTTRNCHIISSNFWTHLCIIIILQDNPEIYHITSSEFLNAPAYGLRTPGHRWLHIHVHPVPLQRPGCAVQRSDAVEEEREVIPRRQDRVPGNRCWVLILLSKHNKLTVLHMFRVCRRVWQVHCGIPDALEKCVQQICRCRGLNQCQNIYVPIPFSEE